jgi:hypothetical protein
MRGQGRPALYTPEERAEANRLSAQRYRQKKTRELEQAKIKIAELQAEVMRLQDTLGVQNMTDADVLNLIA